MNALDLKLIGLVTAVASSIGAQVATTIAPDHVPVTLAVGAASGALGWGIAWGAMRMKAKSQDTRLELQEAARVELKADVNGRIDRVVEALMTGQTRIENKVEEALTFHRSAMGDLQTQVATLTTVFQSTTLEMHRMVATTIHEHMQDCPGAKAVLRRQRKASE